MYVLTYFELNFYRYESTHANSTKAQRIPADWKKIQTILTHTANLNKSKKGQRPQSSQDTDAVSDESFQESQSSNSSYESFKTRWPRN